MNNYSTVWFDFQGARVWIPDPDEVWIGASLLEDWKPGQTTLSLETEESLEVCIYYNIYYNDVLSYSFLSQYTTQSINAGKLTSIQSH